MSSRRVGAAVLVGVLALVGFALVGGQVRLLTTSGNSMAPVFADGDLAVLLPQTHYRPSDVVAYRSQALQVVVLHRVVALQDDGSLLTRGDGNSWLDPDRPRRHEVLGRLVLRVPGGGVWLQRLTSPVLLGVVAFALIAVTGTSPGGRRRRRSHRQTGTSQPRALSLL